MKRTEDVKAGPPRWRKLRSRGTGNVYCESCGTKLADPSAAKCSYPGCGVRLGHVLVFG